jgi:uncharacterized protein
MKHISFFEGKSIGFKVLIFILLIIIGFSLFNILGTLISAFIWSKEELLNTPNAIRLVMVFGTIGSFLFPAFFYLFFEFKSQKQFSISSTFKNLLYPPIKQKKSICLIIILSVLIIPIIAYLGELNQNIKLPHSLVNIENWMTSLENENAAILELLTQNKNISILFVNLLVMAFIPAFCEEFFFRGAVQTIWKSVIKNNHILIFVTAFIFSTIHFQFYGFIPRLILGIYLGYLMVWSGSLFLPILAHFLHNGVSLCIEFFNKSSGNSLEELKISDIHNFYLFIPILLIISIFLIYLIYLDLKQNKIQSI